MLDVEGVLGRYSSFAYFEQVLNFRTGYFDGLVAVYHKLEGAAVQTIVLVQTLLAVGIYPHEHVDNFLYFLAGPAQPAKQPVDVFDHLQVEFLVVGVLLQGVLFDDGLSEVPNVLLHVLG